MINYALIRNDSLALSSSLGWRICELVPLVVLIYKAFQEIVKCKFLLPCVKLTFFKTHVSHIVKLTLNVWSSIHAFNACFTYVAHSAVFWCHNDSIPFVCIFTFSGFVHCVQINHGGANEPVFKKQGQTVKLICTVTNKDTNKVTVSIIHHIKACNQLIDWDPSPSLFYKIIQFAKMSRQFKFLTQAKNRILASSGGPCVTILAAVGIFWRKQKTYPNFIFRVHWLKKSLVDFLEMRHLPFLG